MEELVISSQLICFAEVLIIPYSSLKTDFFLWKFF